MTLHLTWAEPAALPDRPLTEEWLKRVGFKWHQFDRQSSKHWLLWLGDVVRDNSLTGAEDLGIEVAPPLSGDHHWWFCWLRSDTSHKYSRFIHLRHVRTERDLVAVIQGITGVEFVPDNNFYGRMMLPEEADRVRADRDRWDRRLLREGHPWRDVEKDPSRGGAQPEHMEAAIKAGAAK